MSFTTIDTDAVVVSIVCTDEHLDSFTRRLACAVNPGPTHLARVFVLATQVYPARRDTLRGQATITRCEFRMRQADVDIDQTALDDLAKRLTHFEILEHDSVLAPATGSVAELAHAS